MVRCRKVAAVFGLLALTGCEADNVPSPGAFTTMPLTLDYRAHRVVNPPPHYDSGDVAPPSSEPGRARNFEPDARATIPNDADRTGLLAALDTFRRHEPSVGQRMLALARSHKAKAAKKAIDTEAFLDDGAPPDTPQQAEDNGGGTGDGSGKSGDGRVTDTDGGYKLNFEDAEIKDVMQAVLGNVLGLNYTIAPNVTGRITIASAAPQNRAELFSTMETVLSLQGLSLVKEGNVYRIAPMAVGGGASDQNGSEPGFGISVVPVQFTNVATITKVLAGFIVDADGVRIISSQNAIIVRGPRPRREEVVRAIKALDGDWMHQQSVSVFELRRSRPEEIIPELTRIFDADANNEAAGVIQFKAIKRLRSIMVISKNPALIRRAASWIRRLDHQDATVTPSVFIYRPKYREARELTRIVNGLFGNSQGGSGNDSGNVSYVSDDPTNPDSNHNNGQSGQSGSMIGMSSSSYAGGLGGGAGGGSSPGIGSSSGGMGGSPGMGGGLSGGMGGSAGGGAPGLGSSSTGSAGSGQGQTGAGGSNGSNGLQGDLANPVDASQGSGGRNHLALAADTSNNSIVAYTDGETFAKVEAVLRQLDVPPLQVAINVIVAEVDLNDQLQYGVQFYLNGPKINGGSSGSVSLSSVATGTASQVIGAQVPGFNFLVGGASSPDVVINALDQISKVHVLSTPSIVVMENKPAVLEVGDQVPILTQQAVSTLTSLAPTVNSVQYVDTGIILKITPRIGQKGTVTMDLDQVISDVVPDSSGSSTLTPTISKRRIASSIGVRSGQTVLLAGLIKDSRSQTKSHIPFVGGQIGDLLGNKDNSFTRTELIVFIRPVIIRDAKDAQSVAEESRGHLAGINLNAPPIYKR